MDRTSRRGLVPALLLIALAAGCWRQPGFGPLRQGWNPLEDELTAANVATLQPHWTASVDDGPVRSDPVVSAGGLVHVSDDRSAYGFGLGTGDRAWRTAVVPAEIPVARPAHPGTVSSNETQVFVSWSGIPDDGGSMTVDAATGQVVEHLRPFIGSRSTAVRDPWRVTAYSGFVEMTLAGAGISIEGPVPWSVLIDLGGTELLRPPTPAAITADRFFVGLTGGFHGTNVLNGWDLDRGCDPFGLPPACAPDTRTQLDGVPGEAVVADGEATVYVVTQAGTLYAIATATGAIRWTAALGSAVTHRLAWTPDALYVVTDAGRLVAFAPGGCGAATCPPSWSIPLAGSPVAAPAVAGGVVYVASTGGALEAFPAGVPDRPLWSTELSDEITGGPTVAHGTLLVGTEAGEVIAYRPT